jgi:hypothetical protein
VGQHLLRETKAKVCCSRVLVIQFHLDHDAGGVVGKVKGVFFVEINSDNVAIPADALVIVGSLKFLLSFLWTG